jgi:hypothetical protein
MERGITSFDTDVQHAQDSVLENREMTRLEMDRYLSEDRDRPNMLKHTMLTTAGLNWGLRVDRHSKRFGSLING